MSVHIIEQKQQVNRQLDEIWDFFTHPKNLSTITPDYMNFRITSPPHEGDVYPGQIITYKVSPLFKIPMFWMTEITHVIPKKLFVDEQRKGPYKLWHHEHIFEENANGVLMTDRVHYELPLGILGNIAHSVMVKKQLKEIFNYRKNKINELFK